MGMEHKYDMISKHRLNNHTTFSNKLKYIQIVNLHHQETELSSPTLTLRFINQKSKIRVIQIHKRDKLYNNFLDPGHLRWMCRPKR